MRTVCRVVLATFAVLYAGALVLLAIGTFGLFGNERDPLSAVLLIPLGLPWNLLSGMATDAGAILLMVAAPLLNLAWMWIVCRRLSRNR